MLINLSLPVIAVIHDKYSDILQINVIISLVILLTIQQLVMITLKQFLLMLLLTIFASSTIASTALAGCNCSYHSPASTTMACHGIGKTAIDSTKSTNSKNTATCNGCACGRCSLSTSGALPEQGSQQLPFSRAESFIFSSDSVKSLLSYAIDYPPKHIS